METTMAIRHIGFRSNTFAFASVQQLIEGLTRDGIPGSPLLLGLERAKAKRVTEPPCLGTRVLNPKSPNPKTHEAESMKQKA